MSEVKIRIGLNGKVVGILTDGLKTVEYDEDKVNNQHILAAEEAGVDPFRLGRIVGGLPAADSGSKIFDYKYNQHGPHALSLGQIVKDLKAIHYNLTWANVAISNSDGKPYLYLTFSEGKSMRLSAPVKEAIEDLLGKAYRSMRIWMNPNDTITINPNHPTAEHGIPVMSLRLRDSQFVAE